MNAADRLTAYLATVNPQARGYIEQTVKQTNGVPITVRVPDGRTGIALYDCGDGDIAVLFDNQSRHEFVSARSLTVLTGNPKKLCRPPVVTGRSSMMARVAAGIKSGKAFRAR